MKFYPCNRTKCRFYREFELKDDGGMTAKIGSNKHDPLKKWGTTHLVDSGRAFIILSLRCLMCKYFEKQELYCK